MTDKTWEILSEAPVDAEQFHQHVCQRVRNMRKARSWTLDQLASMSGVSRSMLSQIERETANPTLAVAWRIAQAFGLSLGELTELPTSQPKIDVLRHDDPSTIYRDDGQCRIRTLSPPLLEKEIEFYELTLKLNGVLDSAAHYQGTREVLTIEQGAARLTSGSETRDLQKGDSAHYPADVPHKIENISRGTTVAFLVDIYAPRSNGGSR